MNNEIDWIELMMMMKAEVEAEAQAIETFP